MKDTAPNVVKQIFELCQFKCIFTDERNWVMESKGLIALIPHTMRLIPVDILADIVDNAGILEQFEEIAAGLEIQPPIAAPPHQSKTR